jgi:hypothetical protein
MMLMPSVASADPSMGAGSRRGVVSPGEVDAYAIELNGREVTRFVVTGDGDGDIDCYVYDDNGHLAGRDNDSSDTCLIDVRPRWTAQFTIKIANNGGLASAYTMRAF